MGIGQAIHKKEYQRCAFWSVLAFGASVLPLQAGLAQVADNALPQNGNVTGGSASFDYQDNQLDIHQNTDRVVIDWDSFHIGSAAGVEFFQPGSVSIAVNRVIQGVDPTQILGSLKANGTVMILDPNGVVFGQDSRVDVGGIVATTGSIDTNSFMGGSDILDIFNVDTAGVVELRGFISVADAGLAAFVAPTVKNSGVIHARMGRVALASGDAATLDLYGDGLIEIAADDELAGALIDNSGTIMAEGGVVQLSVSMAQSAVDNLINMDGMIDVSSVTQNGGQIILEGGNVLVSGTLNADGKTGGGEILVGGDFQGKGDTLTAKNTLITPEALLSANATGNGDGGKIIVWADQNTGFAGTIEATGGADGGDGGFVEVSGKEYLDFRGDVDLSGDNLGELLLDPDDIDIVAGVANPGEFADDLITFAENGGGTSVLGADTLSGRLSANANVTLQANNTIDVDAAIASTGSGDLTLETSAGGTITVNQAIDVNTGDLTLIGDEIDINAALSGTGDIQLTSADASQEIEIGSTDAADLNLTAAELANLQDGWNLITIGDSAHTTGIIVNEAISFLDDATIVNGNTLSSWIDINSEIMTLNGSNLTLDGSGQPGGGNPHGYYGVHVGADLNVAGDLNVVSGPDFGADTDNIIVGNDFILNASNLANVNANVTANNFTYNGADHHDFRIGANRTFDIANDFTLQKNRFLMYAGSALQVDGNIDITASAVNIDSTATISGNLDGSSNLTFLEYGEDGAMELGGTSAGHNWQLEASEVGVIQDGFNSITFGSNTYTEAIDITGAVSFSDDVSFFNTGSDATITVQDTFTTTDSANAMFESGSAANVGWDAVNIDADMNIAGDLVTRTGAGGGAGHVDVNNANMTIGGDWTLLSDYNGIINTTNLNVGGDIIAERGTKIAAYNFNATNAVIGGDFIIDAQRYLRLNGGTYNVSGAVNFSNQQEGDLVDINANLVAGSSIDISGAGNVDIAGDLTSNGDIVIGSDNDGNEVGAIIISGSTINTNGGDFVAGGGANPLITEAHAAQDGVYDVGVDIDGSTISTGNGDIIINGEGEDTDTNNFGIYLHTDSVLSTTGGDITLNGKGGAGTNYNYGVYLFGADTSVQTVSGDIYISGEADADGTGTSNHGIFMSDGSEIVSMGVGPGTGNITIHGIAGSGDRNNRGFQMRRNGTRVATVDGDIDITGQGDSSGGGDGNHGFSMLDQAQIVSTGTGTNAGTISITGTAGDGDSENYGIYLLDDDTLITSIDGAISLDGTGGRGASGGSNHGIYFHDGADVLSTGTTSNAATISLAGLAGDGSSEGVYIQGGTVVSGYGDIAITGTDDAVSNARGIFISNFDTTATETKVESTGIGNNAADITINGTSDSNDGVFLHVGADVVSVDGDIDIDGSGTTGVYVRFGSSVRSTGTGANAGNINISGIASDGSGNRNGVQIWHSSYLSTVDGNIDMTGQGGDSTTGHAYGLVLGETGNANSYIQTTGDGDITIDATAGDCSLGNCYGVFLQEGAGGEAHIATTSTGNIDITGRGGNTGSDNYGIFLEGGSYIESTASGADAGTITLNGTGGNGVNNNHGVYIDNTAYAGTRITSLDGDISITGVGQGTGEYNTGINLDFQAPITSTGNTSNGAGITLHGTGGNGTNRNSGVFIEGNGANITSVATGANAKDIRITGVAGAASGRDNYGVSFSNAGDRVTSVDADIYINGTGGGNDVRGYGVRLKHGHIHTTGTSSNAGNIYLTGTASSSNTNNNIGIYVQSHSTDSLRTASGDIVVEGIGGVGSGLNNHGIDMQELASTAQLTTFRTTNGGDLSITGDAGPDTSSQDLYIEYVTNGSGLGDASMTGDITLNLDTFLIDSGAFIETQGDLTIRNRTAGTSIGLGGGAGDLNIDDAELAQFIVGGKLTVGSANAGLVTIDSVDVTAGAYATDIIGRNIIVENGLDVGNAVYLRSTQGDIRLNSGTVRAAGGGSSLVLNAARDFVNNAGPAALDAGIGGRFLVYASDLETSLRGDIMASVIEGETFTSLPPASVPAGDRFIFVRNPFTEITSDITAQIQNFVAKDVNTEVKQDRPANTPRGKDESLLLETENDQTLIMDGVSCDSFGSNVSSCVLN